MHIVILYLKTNVLAEAETAAYPCKSDQHIPLFRSSGSSAWAWLTGLCRLVRTQNADRYSAPQREIGEDPARLHATLQRYLRPVAISPVVESLLLWL